MAGMKCISFNQDFTHKSWTLYYVKYSDGRVIQVWARDSVDVIDVFGNDSVVEYGNVI